MKKSLFLLSFLSLLLTSAVYATESTTNTEENSVLVTITDPITGSMTINDGKTHTLTHSVTEELENGAEPKDTTKAVDLASGTLSVSGEGSILKVETNGSLGIASGGGSDTASLIASEGGIIDLHSTASSNANASSDNWYKTIIGGTLEEGASPTAELKATGAGSQIIIRSGAHSGAYNTPPNAARGGIYLGLEPTDNSSPVVSKGTVNITAENGGSVMLHDDGKSAYAPVVHSWIEQLIIVVSGETSSFSSGAAFHTYGNTTIDISNKGTVNFGLTTMADGTPRSSTLGPLYYEYNTQRGGSTTLNVDGAGSVANFEGNYRIYSADDYFNVTDGGKVVIKGYLGNSITDSQLTGKLTMNISGAGSSVSVAGMSEEINGTTYFFSGHNSGGTNKFNVKDGGSLSFQQYTNANNSQHLGNTEITVSGTDATGQASTFTNTGNTTNQGGSTMTLTAENGGVVTLGGQFYNASGTVTLNALAGGLIDLTHGAHFAGATNYVTVDGSGSDQTTMARFVRYYTYASGAKSFIDIKNAGVMNVRSYYQNSANTESTINISQGGKLELFGQYSSGDKIYYKEFYNAGTVTMDIANQGSAANLTQLNNAKDLTLSIRDKGRVEAMQFNNYSTATSAVTVEGDATLVVEKFRNDSNLYGGITLNIGSEQNAGGALSISQYYYNYNDATTTFNITNGGQLLLNNAFSFIGNTNIPTYYNYGTTTFNLTSSGSVNISDYQNAQGAATTINIGEVNVATPAASTLSLAAEQEESGSVSTQSFQANRYANNGTTNFNVAENGKLTIGTYVNDGDSTINVASGSTVQINDLQLLNGSMNLLGDGDYVLGAAAQGVNTNTLFTVSGSTTATNINFADAPNLTFTIDADTQFTLQFTDEALAGITVGSSADFTLVLVYGNSAFGEYMEQADLIALLTQTEYVFGSNEDSTENAYTVKEGSASYKKDGNNLVWTGTINNGVVPEPGTATLSLLGLAAMLMRRSRKNN